MLKQGGPAGKSPLLGSPWPYLMHKRKNHNPPLEHVGPTTVPEGTEQGDDAEVIPLLASCHNVAPAVQHPRAHLSWPVALSSQRVAGSALLQLSNACLSWSCAAQADEEDMLNPLASDAAEPASMGHRRSGRLEERLSFVSGRGSWHPTSGGPDTNGTAAPAFPLHPSWSTLVFLILRLREVVAQACVSAKSMPHSIHSCPMGVWEPPQHRTAAAAAKAGDCQKPRPFPVCRGCLEVLPVAQGLQ